MSFEELGEPGTATQFETISVSDESTVVAEYVPAATGSPSQVAYQSEADLEAALIKQLEGQAYERLVITNNAALVVNLRKQLEALNKIEFTDAEWKRFFEVIAGANEGIVEKTARIQEDHVQVLKRDDGTSKNVYLIDKQNIHNNRLQVINQYEVDGAYKNRYDVTILVNGLPMVHIELKRRGVDIREAFNQINRYQRDSFWADSGLFNYVQLFVISNGTLTKYYSNTTAAAAHAELTGAKPAKRRTSNSFEFTSWWADASNKPITGLTGFTATFFAKHTLLNLLTKYCVFDVDRKLLVMRPYQIVAAEKILQRIETSTNYKRTGTLAAGGYVWHTTGSGKTLTSFKAAQLAAKLPHVDKVMFVVDRKDLDYQTMREYNRFEKDSVNGSKNTAELKRQLEKPSARIVVTTIQKLARFIQANKGHQIYGGHIVLIFDECHRSQFGDMHTAITKGFKNYHLFGFTGTPIFAENAGTSGNVNLRTTEQAFGDRLHTYTIVDAINDKNVLPFRIDYVNTIKVPDGLSDKQVAAIDTEKALLAPERLSQVVSYIREHFDQKTRRNSTYTLGERRVAGFNSIFATASITAAKHYYEEFRKQQGELPVAQRLKVGLIYSFAANEAEDDGSGGFLGEEDFETGALDASSRDFLEAAIKDYNAIFGTSFDTSADRFQNYYKDLSLRLKNRELDMVIVVNMFLTGFDATTLNTLWVDKNLRSHGLIQAYSRTNRILNSVKTYGTIVSFRDLEEATNDALALFGNKDARGVVILKPYGDYCGEYEKQVAELLERFPLEDAPYVGEANQKAFIALFGAILRLRNILSSFDEFAGHELISPREFQDFQSVYLNLYADWRGAKDAEKESINDDVVFEIELIKQVEVNVDYILTLVQAFRDSIGNSDREMDALMTIQRAVDSSPSLRNKKDLILQFVDSVSITGDTSEDWKVFVVAKRDAELDALIAEEALKADETKTFVADAFRDGAVPTAGTAITRILPPASRFSPGGDHGAKKQRVLDKLAEFFDRYFGLV